jgi:predicted phosphoribosyltransferase
MKHFDDRLDAARQLTERVQQLDLDRPIVLALPRGGVVVGAALARALHAPFDVAFVRKLRVPFQTDLALGAIGENGVLVLNEAVMSAAHMSSNEVVAIERFERDELDRLARRVRGAHAAIDVSSRTVIVVDDGSATGATARAALRTVRARGASRVIVALPVAPLDVFTSLCADADEVVCLACPDRVPAVGAWYETFPAVTDEEVTALLAGAGPEEERLPPTWHATVVFDGDVAIDVRDDLALDARLVVPERASGCVVVADASSAGRYTPRQRTMGGALVEAGFAVLRADLLAEDEAMQRAEVFDIPKLADRLARVTEWCRDHALLRSLPLGYEGDATATAAVLWVAAEDRGISALACYSPRPDLVRHRLARVHAATLLVVRSGDAVLTAINRSAVHHLSCPFRLEVVAVTSNVVGGTVATERLADLAAQWFGRFMARAGDAGT